MKLKETIKRTLAALYKSIIRFPATLFLTFSVTVMLITIIELDPDISRSLEEYLIRITLILAMGIPVSLIVKFIIEKKENIKSIYEAVLYLCSAAFLAIYYFFFLTDFDMVPITRYIILSAIFYLAAIVIPYFYRRDFFELYVVRLITRFFTSVLFSAVLLIGIFLILFTVDALLDIKVYDKLYFYVFLVLAGIFAPTHFLAGVPLKTQNLDSDSLPALLRILLLYIVMPLILAYTTILYIYFIKIIITLKWPVGLVAQLVLWYCMVSIIVMFLASPLKEGSKWAKTFIFWFPKLVIPLLIMLYIAVWIRISSYGITEYRYFVILAALWVTGIMTYLNLSKIKRNIIIPVSLSIVMLISIVGPTSAYTISKFSQNQRFSKILVKYGMLTDSRIVKPKREINQKDGTEIIGILEYFDKNHSLRDVRYLPKDFELNDKTLRKTFGIPYEKNNYLLEKYFSYYVKEYSNISEVKGYDFMYNSTYTGEALFKGYKLKSKYDRLSNEYTLTYNGKEIYRQNLKVYADKLNEQFDENYNNALEEKYMIFTDENKKVKIKFMFFNISGHKESSDKTVIDSLDFSSLIKIK